MSGYVGVYLCRKNLAVAMPLLQDTLGATKEQVGRIASIGALTYTMGKLLSGPLVDRLGGRPSFLASLFLVALFAALGSLSPGLTALAVFYGLNRLMGSASWGSMIKLVPTWFGRERVATLVGVMSLSWVVGSLTATLLARQIVKATGSWRSVMGLPAFVLLAVALCCVPLVRPGPLEKLAREGARRSVRYNLFALLRQRRFLIGLGLSFTLTLVREAFDTWSVDFLTSVQQGTHSVTTAALQSIGFDIAGGASIVFSGMAYDRIAQRNRHLLFFCMLALLSALLLVLPTMGRASALSASALVGLVGLLVYGPFSILGSVLVVETGGTEQAATAAGLMDGIGYFGGILTGSCLGWLLDRGGYSLGFSVLAATTALAALLTLGLRQSRTPLDGG
jgi:OPA family glycerol-3-phosphate transporter-like MFS transporter